MNNSTLTELIKDLQYPTPYYLFSRQKLRSNLEEFQKFIPAKVHYALKSNPNNEVLEVLHEQGSGFEVASIAELEKLIQIGVKPGDILFSAPVKPAMAIHRAYELGVDRFAFDSRQELEKITQSAPGSKVYLRISVTEHGSRFSLSEKFGVKLENAVGLMVYARSLRLRPYGLTFHIGSQATAKASWTYAIRTAAKAMVQLQEAGIKIRMLDIGGGFPVQYAEPVPSLQEIAKTINTALKKYLPYEVELVAEPGRALVATSATLVMSIFSKIRRGQRTWLFTDAGAYNSLFETLDSQTAMKFEIYHILESYNKRKLQKCVITGPTCDSIDTIFKDVELPSELHVEDKLCVPNAGAYTIALANSFNGFAQPKVYFTD